MNAFMACITHEQFPSPSCSIPVEVFVNWMWAVQYALLLFFIIQFSPWHGLYVRVYFHFFHFSDVARHKARLKLLSDDSTLWPGVE